MKIVSSRKLIRNCLKKGTRDAWNSSRVNQIDLNGLIQEGNISFKNI